MNTQGVFSGASGVAGNSGSTGKEKQKTGRKKGYRMPKWKKDLQSSLRDYRSIQAVNSVMTRIGEVLTEAAESQNAEFIVTTHGGKKKKTMVLVWFNEKQTPNNRTFLFMDPELNARTSFPTQEIYNGIISGGFSPVTPIVRERLFRVILESPEVQTHIRERAERTRENGKTAKPASGKKNMAQPHLFFPGGDMDMDDDGVISINFDEVNPELLSEMEKACGADSAGSALPENSDSEEE